MNSTQVLDDSEGARRTMAYCHDGVGLGHFHRTLAICERVRRCDPASTFLLVTGTPYVPIFNLPSGVDYVKLPSLAKQGKEKYEGKYLKASPDRILHCREALLLSAAQSFEPAVLLVDKAPAGVRGELLPTLRWLRRHRPETRIVFGMRDIEDDPQTTIQQWSSNGAVHALEEYYHEIWVYGMRSVFDVAQEYRLPQGVQDKLRFVGYVVQDPCTHDLGAGRSESGVLVTVGGGTDGEFVLETYLEEAAPRVSAAGIRSTIVGGPDLPGPAARRLYGVASHFPEVEWFDHVPCMCCRIRQANVIVSMGGYNTLCEVVSNRKPAVVIPRTSPRLEQTMRAQLWSRRAPLDVILPEELTASSLADRILLLLGRARPVTEPDLDFHGLDQVYARFKTFWNGACDASAVCVH